MQAEFEDSNIALLGSDLELEVRKKAAETEEAYQGAGQECGILIWRIESFKVVPWEKEQYGRFYDGDSFIVLHTYEKEDSEALLHDIYFWLGAESSQDEMGVAAYMTVVLDDLLGTTPVQHREVQGFESDGFVKLWDNKMCVMKGGVASGFNHVEPDDYEDRLLIVKGTRKLIKVQQVENSTSSMNQGDVFIFDHGVMIYQWNGESSGVWEKRKANELVEAIQSERSGRAESQILDGLEDSEMWDLIPGDRDDIGAAKEDDEEVKGEVVEKKLLKVSDASGELEVSEVEFARDNLESADVFIVDIGDHLDVWIGKDASRNEQRKGMKYAVDYLISNGRPLHTPVVRMVEGRETAHLDSHFGEGSI